MTSDLELARLIHELYQPAPIGLDCVEQTAGVFWGLKRLDDGDVVILRGSVTPEDWLRDLDSELARTLSDCPAIGPLPLGFSEGLREVYSVISSLLRPLPTTFTGHSLGGAHATELAGIHACHGRPIAQIMVCGSPRPGTQLLARAVTAHSPMTSYRNVGDPVPGVPVPIPLVLPWEHPVPLIPLPVVLSSTVDFPFVAHSFDTYLAGLERRYSQ